MEIGGYCKGYARAGSGWRRMERADLSGQPAWEMQLVKTRKGLREPEMEAKRGQAVPIQKRRPRQKPRGLYLKALWSHTPSLREKAGSTGRGFGLSGGSLPAPTPPLPP
jgi:hypothetical protein